MEGELWRMVQGIVREIDQTWNNKYQQYSHGRIVEIYLWAVLHDRPVCWACHGRNWP